MKFRQGIHVLFLLVFAAAGAQGQINTGGGAVANRLFKGSGIPSSGCATAGDVNKVYVQGNVLATTSPLYICSEVSSGVYAWVNSGTSSGGSGTLTNFASGNLSPLFTTSVATPTTIPSQTFSLSNAAQNSVFAGPASGGAGAPSYQLAPTFSGANITGIPNAGLNNSAITIGGTSVALGGSTTALPNPGAIGGGTPSTGAFTSLSTGSSPPALTAGTGGAQAMNCGTVPSIGPASGNYVAYCDGTFVGRLVNRNNLGYLPEVLGPASPTSNNVPQWASEGILGAGFALGTNVQTFLTTPSPANFNSAMTGPVQVGTGGTGVANTATLTLGTSNQNWATLGTGIVKNTTTTGALSNATSSDILGLCVTCVTSAASLTNNALMIGQGSQGSATTTTGTGVVTALGVNTGSVGAFVVNGGALGTPSSGNASNLSSFPTLNQNTTGYAAGIAGGAGGSVPYQTAANTTGFLSSTGYSVMVSGAANPAWATPTANGQCFMSGASSYATTTPSFQPCPGGGGGLTINSTTISGGATNAILYGDGTVLQNATGVTRTATGQFTYTQTALGTTPNDAIELVNTTAAASGLQQISPSLHWSGQGWKTTATAASQAVDWISYMLPVQGTANPTSQLNFAASINGGSYTNAMTLTNPNTGSNNNTTLTLGNASVTTNNNNWGFGSTIGSSADVALSNPGKICWVTAPTAGCGGTIYAVLNQTGSTSNIIQVGAGAVGSGGSFRAASFQSGGTKFTISGCSAGTTVGGATAGSFASGSTGACTVVITMNGATGLTAPNGWACHAADLTTPANLISQSATSTTTCTVTGTTVSGDTIDFLAMAY